MLAVNVFVGFLIALVAALFVREVRAENLRLATRSATVRS